MNANPETVCLLVVDDDDLVAEALERQFRREKIPNPLIHARDGVEALEHLRSADPETRVIPPYVILLDLRMPRMDGFEFLKELRADRRLSRSVVFVMTTSDNEEDIVRAYDQHVAGYMVKRDVGKNFQHAIEMLGLYWAAVALPQE